VEGIEEYYKNDRLMRFSVTPSTNGYLKIFNVNDEVSSLLYPYKDEDRPYLNDNTDFQLKAMEETWFPVHNAFSDGYFIEIEKPDKDKEFNLLIFVFTRENIAFLDDASDMKEIMAWIYSIPPEKRVVKQFGFIINR
jgi:hypothetical protein